MDYRALNEITVKNRYPIPRIGGAEDEEEVEGQEDLSGQQLLPTSSKWIPGYGLAF